MLRHRRDSFAWVFGTKRFDKRRVREYLHKSDFVVVLYWLATLELFSASLGLEQLEFVRSRYDDGARRAAVFDV